MKKPSINRREFVATLATSTTIGIVGCSSNVQDSDGDGMIDSEDYAPQDPDVQQKSDVSNGDPIETTPEPEPYEVFDQPSCTSDSIFKLVGAEFTPPSDSAFGITTVKTVGIENIGSERAYDITVVASDRDLNSIVGRGSYGRYTTDDIVEGGTRFTAYMDAKLEAPLEDVSIYLKGEFDTRYGDLTKPCV